MGAAVRMACGQVAAAIATSCLISATGTASASLGTVQWHAGVQHPCESSGQDSLSVSAVEPQQQLWLSAVAQLQFAANSPLAQQQGENTASGNTSARQVIKTAVCRMTFITELYRNSRKGTTSVARRDAVHACELSWAPAYAPNVLQSAPGTTRSAIPGQTSWVPRS